MKKRTGITGLAALALIATAGCTASPSATDAAGGSAGAGAGAGSLRIGEPYDLGTLDPQLITVNGDRDISGNIIEGLTRYEPGDLKLVPGLATSWSSNAAGTTWTFELRQGVKFQKGFGLLKASDVVFSLLRLKSKELASPNSSLVRSIVGVRADGDNRVLIDLKSPSPTLLDTLASSYTGIVSEKAATAKGAAFSRDPVGTGPYQFDHWTAGQETVLTAFNDYWRAKPGLAKVTFKPIPDPTTLNNAFQAGELDLIHVTDPDVLGRYKKNKDVTVSSVPSLTTRFFGMRSDQKPFDDPRVRQAMVAAVDQQALVKGLFGGVAAPATGPLAPAVKYAAQGVLNQNYDPDKSRALLAQAGYPQGLDVNFSVPNVDRFTRPATVIQQDLAKVGVRAKIQVMESQSFVAALQSPAGLPMFMVSLTQTPAPDLVLSSWFGSAGIPGRNFARINDPEIDKWLGQATTTLDEGARATLFKQVQTKVGQGDYYYFTDQELSIYATRSKVKGFVADPLTLFRLDHVTVAS